MIVRKLLFLQLNQKTHKIQKILEVDDEVQVEEIHEVVVQVDEEVLEGDHQVDEEAYDDEEEDECHSQKIIVLREIFLLVIMMENVLML